MFKTQKAKRNMNIELDLVAFISLLSVCICFLLLTTIWVQIGSMDVKQSVGGQAAEGAPKPEMWILMAEGGDLKFELRNLPASVLKMFAGQKISAKEGRPNFEDLNAYISKLTQEASTLSMALIRPTENTPFEDIIQLMDTVRESGIQDLGVTPL